jgi:hypothetical protein
MWAKDIGLFSFCPFGNEDINVDSPSSHASLSRKRAMVV